MVISTLHMRGLNEFTWFGSNVSILRESLDSSSCNLGRGDSDEALEAVKARDRCPRADTTLDWMLKGRCRMRSTSEARSL